MKKYILFILIIFVSSLYSNTICLFSPFKPIERIKKETTFVLNSNHKQLSICLLLDSIRANSRRIVFNTNIYFQDADNDGYGNDEVSVEAEVPPNGYVLIGGDCDDTNNTIYPGAVEICFDGIDQDCDGYLTQGCPVITTQLLSENCGVNLTSINQTLRANYYSQSLPAGVFAFRYRFRVTNLLTNEIRIIERANYIFQLTYTNFAEYNTPYSVEVQLRLNQEWTGEYGPACTIITPSVPPSQLAFTSCGSTVEQMNNIIKADVVPVATNYEYEVSLIEEGIPVETTTLTIPNPSFNLLLLNGISIKYASEYRVRIRVQAPTPSGLMWSSTFGEPCSVFTPFAPIVSIEGCESEDGIAASSMNEIVFASPTGGATLYRFTLADDFGYLQTRTTPNRYFRLSNFDALSPLASGREYSVKVEVLIYNYFYSGKDCNIKTPGTPQLPLLKNPFVVTDEHISFDKAIAYPNPFSTTFSIDLISVSLNPIKLVIYDTTGRLLATHQMKPNQLSKLSLGELYASGIYNLVLIQNDQIKTVRVVKQ